MNITTYVKPKSVQMVCQNPAVLPCVWYILRSFVFLCGFLMYCFVAFVIYRLYIRYRTPYYAFTFSLAVCNNLVIVYNLIVTPISCTEQLQSEILQVFGKFLEMSSYFHMVGISLSRLTAVMYVQDCPEWLKKSGWNVGAIWMCGAMWAAYHSTSLYLYDKQYLPHLCAMRYVEFVICMTAICLIFSLTLATGYNLWRRKSLLERTPSRKISAYRRQFKLFVRCFIQCSLLFYTIVTELSAANSIPSRHNPDVYYSMIVVGRHIAYTAYFICPPILCLSFDNLVQHAAMTKAI